MPSAIPATAKARGKIAPAKFAHIVYRTPRYAEMIDWHCKVLEAQVMSASPMLTFLTFDDEHHRVAIVNMPGLEDRPAGAAGVDHCAYAYGSLDDLFATYERLAGEGIKPYWCINHGITLSMYYRDPDNNQVEFQVDAFDSVQAINDWFAQGHFDANQIGVKFDPEALIERHRNGEDRATLLTNPTIKPEEVLAQLPNPA